MADELRRLQELNTSLKLVPKGETLDELRRNASAFTHEAARLLWSEGWRRIAKPDGVNVDGLDIDKLVNVRSRAIVDIIVAAGAKNAFIAWQDAGTLADTSRDVEVRPVDAPPAPAPVERDELILTLVEIGGGIDGLISAVSELNESIRKIHAEQVAMRELVERAIGRFIP